MRATGPHLDHTDRTAAPSRPARWCAALLLLAFCAAGCDRQTTSSQPATGKLLKIAVIPKATNHEYWKSVHAGAVKAERELSGVQIIWKGPPREDDRDGQIGTVENFINAGVAGIVVAPLDDTALVQPVRHATQAGIPVAIMDSGLKADAGADYVTYVATDNLNGGRKAARRMNDVLGGKGKVIVLRYQVGSASTTQREDGFIAELKEKFPAIQIVSDDQHAGATTDEAYARAENLLNRYPDVNGVFGPCEPVVFGVLRALHASGKAGQVKLVGFDRSEKLLEAMTKGQVHGLVLQDPLRIGYESVRALVAHLRGEKVPTRIDTGSVVATPENMKDRVVAELLSPPLEKYLQ